MKIKTLIAAALILGTGSAIGQEEVKTKMSKAERLTQELNLDEKQSAEVALIMEESKKDMKTVRANKGYTEEERRAAIKDVRLKTDTKIMSVLNKEQASTYIEMKKEKKEKTKEKMGMKAKDKMAEELGLSEEQAAQMKKVKEKAKQERTAITSNTELTEEQKKKELRSVRKSADANIKEILTDEQYKKMKELKAEKKEKRAAKKTMEK